VEKNSKKAANKVRECQVNKRQEKKEISQTAAKKSGSVKKTKDKGIRELV